MARIRIIIEDAESQILSEQDFDYKLTISDGRFGTLERGKEFLKKSGYGHWKTQNVA